MQNKLRQEKVETKVHQQKIKKLQVYLLAIHNEENKGYITKKILEGKENTIQLLNKKLKICATQLIQDSKLTELEKQKEIIAKELSDSKERILNLVEEKECEKEKGLLNEKIDVLNERKLVLEKEK